MDSNPNPNPSSSSTPDLASVLRILASLTPQTETPQPQLPSQPQAPQDLLQSLHQPPTQTFQSHLQHPQQYNYPPQQPQPPPQNQRTWTPPYEPPPAQIPVPSYPTQQHQHQPPQFRPQSQTQQQPQQKIVDPATITDWSAGLRCAMKTLAKHENILHDVRKMIKVQHEHEEQWSAGRRDLIKRQNARQEGQKKLDEVLKSIGGAAPSTTETNTDNTSPSALLEELKTFDMKVYRAQLQMVREMTVRLKGFGIPFFGTRKELIRPKGEMDQEGMIREDELVVLQRKMLALLEEMCQE